MYQAIEATSKSGVIQPLEPVSFVEDERLIILRLSRPAEVEPGARSQAADWRKWVGVLKGSPHLNEDPLVIQKVMRHEWG